MALGHDGGTAAEPFTPASTARENRTPDPIPTDRSTQRRTKQTRRPAPPTPHSHQ